MQFAGPSMEYTAGSGVGPNHQWFGTINQVSVTSQVINAANTTAFGQYTGGVSFNNQSPPEIYDAVSNQKTWVASTIFL
jgi:hypothetical protein